MFNLLKVELYKLKKFQFGYIAVLFFLVIGIIGGGYKLPNYCDNTAAIFACNISDTSLVFVISLTAAFFIGKDFSNRTICNEVKLGYNRFHILLSRMIIVCTFAAFLHTLWVITNVLSFAVVRGFDASVLCVENALWLFTVLVQLSAVLSGVVLISFITKKVPETIALSSMYVLIGCNILRNLTDAKIFTRSCFYFVQDNSTENLLFSLISAFVTMMIFLTIAVFTFKKAEIK